MAAHMGQYTAQFVPIAQQMIRTAEEHGSPYAAQLSQVVDRFANLSAHLDAVCSTKDRILANLRSARHPSRRRALQNEFQNLRKTSALILDHMCQRHAEWRSLMGANIAYCYPPL
jgi:hypothetical protein